MGYLCGPVDLLKTFPMMPKKTQEIKVLYKTLNFTGLDKTAAIWHNNYRISEAAPGTKAGSITMLSSHLRTSSTNL